MTRSSLIALAAGGSAALVLGAWAFQLMGWQPCAMCLWQRWPHYAAVLIGVVALSVPGRALPLLGALAAAATAAIGVYHSGVERKWWEGPSSCTGTGGLDGLSGADLLSTDAPALVLCDTFTPFFLGLSMANWNAIASSLLVLVWLAAARR